MAAPARTPTKTPPSRDREVATLSALPLPPAPEGTELVTPPEWIPLCPAPNADGLVEARDGRSFYVEDPATIIEASELPMGLDCDHKALGGWLTEAETDAFGWVDRIEYIEEADEQRSEPGFWGHIERWTSLGRPLIEQAIFRGISPVLEVEPRYDVDPETEEVTRLAPQVRRFLRGPALTNRPALTHPMLFNEQRPKTTPGAPPREEEPMNEKLRTLGLSLGLSGDFTPEMLAEAINQGMVPRSELDALKTRAETAEKALEDDRKQRFEAAADEAVDAACAAGKITPAAKAFFRQTITDDASLAAFRQHVDAQASITQPAPQDPERPEGSALSALNDEDRRVAELYGYSPEVFAEEKANAVKRQQAFADGEEPGTGDALTFATFKKRQKAALEAARESR